MGFIKQLKQFITGEHIFPITKSNAVYDDKFGRLDVALQNVTNVRDKQYIQYGTVTCEYWSGYFLRTVIRLEKNYNGKFIGIATKASNTADASTHVSCLVDGTNNTLTVMIESSIGAFTQADTRQVYWMTVGELADS